MGKLVLSKIRANMLKVRKYGGSEQPDDPDEPGTVPIDGSTRVWWSDNEEDYTDVPITGELAYNSLDVDGHVQKDAVKIQIGTDVTKIGYDALSGCIMLKSVDIPESVGEIADRAFMNCTSLIGVSIPKSTYYGGVGDSAFSGCSSLRHIEFPVDIDLRKLGSGLFYGCSSLESIEIPQSVRSVFSGAFSGCSSLTSLTIPSGVTYIGKNAFADCSSMGIVMFLGKTMQQVKDIENATGSSSWEGDSFIRYYPWGLDESVIHAELDDEEPSIYDVPEFLEELEQINQENPIPENVPTYQTVLAISNEPHSDDGEEEGSEARDLDEIFLYEGEDGEGEYISRPVQEDMEILPIDEEENQNG